MASEVKISYHEHGGTSPLQRSHDISLFLVRPVERIDDGHQDNEQVE
jgi:hypothetical protein